MNIQEIICDNIEGLLYYDGIKYIYVLCYSVSQWLFVCAHQFPWTKFSNEFQSMILSMAIYTNWKSYILLILLCNKGCTPERRYVTKEQYVHYIILTNTPF